MKAFAHFFRYLRVVIFLGAVTVGVTATEMSVSCPHGTLDTRFCDRNGDMLADPEPDPKRWLDPYTLVFGYTENQALHDYARAALAHDLEKATGKRVRFFRYRTNAAQLEAMRSGLVHIVGLNTGSVPEGVRCSGFRLFAMAAKADGSYGYTMQIITWPGSGIRTMEDLRDQTILFVTPTSNSGYKAPRALLKERYNLTEGIDYRVRFSGTHTKSILAVARHQAKVAAIADGVLNSMIDAGTIKKEDIFILYTSQSFPGTGYGYPYNLKPALAKKIEATFFGFRLQDANGTLRDVNQYHDALFIPAQYREKWAIIRQIDHFNNPDQSCR
jgi:phosphonate transport system substrate-binding protein